MSTLSTILNAARGDLSVREVGRRAEGIGESTVIPYFNGNHGTPSVAVLTALADVLDIPLSQLREAAGLPAGERQPYEPPAEADLLGRRARLALDELIRSFVAEIQETRHVEHLHTADRPSTEESRAPRAEDEKNKADTLIEGDQGVGIEGGLPNQAKIRKVRSDLAGEAERLKGSNQDEQLGRRQ